jgi:BppU N-terminal domain
MRLVKRNDTYDYIEYQVKDNTYDFTDCSVLFQMEASDGKLLVSSLGEVVDTEKGILRYHFVEGDTYRLGTHKGEFRVTFSDGEVKSFPEDQGFLTIIINENIDSNRSTFIEEVVALRVAEIEKYRDGLMALFVQYVEDNELFKNNLKADYDAYKEELLVENEAFKNEVRQMLDGQTT